MYGKFTGSICGSYRKKDTFASKKKILHSHIEGDEIRVKAVISLNEYGEEEITVSYFEYDTINKSSSWILKRTETFKK